MEVSSAFMVLFQQLDWEATWPLEEDEDDEYQCVCNGSEWEGGITLLIKMAIPATGVKNAADLEEKPDPEKCRRPRVTE